MTNLTQQEIEEGNKLIAEFMNWHYIPAEQLKQADGLFANGTERRKVKDMQYNYDFALLMPAVEKISRLKIGDGVEYIDYAYPRTFGMLNADTGKIMVRLNGHSLHEADTLIEATFRAVIEFIKFRYT